MCSTAAAAVKECDTFRERFPYQLIPTNVPGVFTSPARPEGFDPKTASAASLIKHGLLWRRPGKGDHPGVVVAWERLSSRRWHAKDRMVPFLQPQPGKTPHLKGRRKTNAGIQNDWSGGSVKGQWAACVGTWAILTVSQPSEGQGQESGWNSSSWAGIDGAYCSNDVLQVGAALASLNGNIYTAWKGDGNDNLSVIVSTDNGRSFPEHNKLISPETSDQAPTLAVNNGTVFIAWKGGGDDNDNPSVSLVDVTGFAIPMYVNQTNIPNFPVKPGGTVSSSVQCMNNQTASYIYFANETAGEQFSLAVAPSPGVKFDGESIEWIMEVPDFGEPNSSLPSFTPVQFTGAFGCSAIDQALGDAQTGDIWNIVNASNNQPTSVT